MSKFIQGEAVICVDNEDASHYLKIGKTYTIRRYQNDAVYVVDETGHEFGYKPNRFKKLLPPVEYPAQPANEAGQDELDTLIAKANDGLAALNRLSSRKDEVESRHRDGSVAPCHPSYEIFEVLYSHLASGYLAGEIQLRRKKKAKPRPQFAAFTTSNGWKVHVERDNLHIGCRHWGARQFHEALRKLIDEEYRNVVVGNHEDTLVPTYKGVYSDNADETLPWPDAEALYEALKAYAEQESTSDKGVKS